jgi:tetratricopeptide (TPR) repeat protein
MGLISRNRSVGVLIAVSIAALFAFQISGCGSKPVRPTSSARSLTKEQSQYRDDVLHSAIVLLNTPEQMDDDDEASKQLVAWLNQWRRLTREAEQLAQADSDAKAKTAAKPDDDKADEVDDAAKPNNPLIDSLPEKLKSSRWVRRLNNDLFDPQYDGTFLREAALLREVAGHVEAESHDDLATAQALFDWTVRNIQLEPQPLADSPPEEQWLARHLPIETLFYGRGTWRQRAWVFMLLGRQAGLDVVLLATPDPNNPREPRPWLTALFSGGELYLFDPNFGLPIPGPGGHGVATLSQAAADDAVLRQMDVPGGQAYPRKASDLQKVVALVDGTPGYFEPRMKLLESQLTGHDRIVLSTDPAALADKLRQAPHIDQVMLWTMPLETLLQRTPPAPEKLAPPIERARFLERLPFMIQYLPDPSSKQSEDSRRQPRPICALRLGRLLQLRGALGGSNLNRTADDPNAKTSEIVEHGAKYYLIRSIITQAKLDEIRRLVESHSDVSGRVLTKEDLDAHQQHRDDAAYWLGLILLEQQNYDGAQQYFGKMTLEAAANNAWTNGARYNLARCYEALGQFPEAIKLYEADRSPQRNGNYLRAARLKKETAAGAPKPRENKK